MNLRRVWLVLSLAVAATALNAMKPPVIDDPAYLGYARQFHDHPSRPYDFEYYGKPANGYLVPPVLPAWLAFGMSVVGDDPVWLKLWLFPFLLLYVGSLSLLLRRFAGSLQTPLLVLSVFSPAILPSINLMLDVPELALALSALALFLHASDRQSLWRALGAGLVAGLAMETKYTAFTLPGRLCGPRLPVWALAPGADRRGRSVAWGSFTGCELAIAVVHGDSHFQLAMSGRGQRPLVNAVRLMAAGTAISGGLAPILWLMGLVALGFSRRNVIALLGLVAIGYALLAIVPPPYDVLVVDPDNDHPMLILNHVFVPQGIAFEATLILAAAFVASVARRPRASQRKSDFLVLWLLIEVLGYLTISPFPAVRRLLGIFIAATILVGRLAAQNGMKRERLFLIRGLTAAGVVLGLGYYLIDLADALSERSAFDRAVAYVRQQDPQAAIRFHGTWGCLTHSERAGLIWTRNVGQDLQAGDWFIHDFRDGLPIHPAVLPDLEPLQTFVEEARFPLTTQRTFYASRTPIVRFDGPRMEVNVYRYRPKLE